MLWDERIGRRIKLRDLQILLAVVQTGSMAKASSQLAVSQPAVSKAIAEMERALGVRLLTRTPMGVEPTDYGRALIKRSTIVFDELRQGIKEIEFIADPTVGEIRIGSTEPLGEGLVTAAIDRLSRKYPRISFEVVQDDPVTLIRELEHRNVELVLARLFEPIGEHMKAEIFYSDAFVIIAGAKNPWARRRKVELAELIDEPWTLMPRDTFTGATILEAFRAEGLEPPRATVATSSLSLRNSLLATGRFLSTRPAATLKFSSGYVAIKALPIELPTTRRPVGLITLKSRVLSPVAQLFIDCARDIAKSRPAWSGQRRQN